MITCWRNELNNYRNEVLNGKEKLQKVFFKNLAILEKKPPVNLLKHMLYRCKVIHSLAFFQWRYYNAKRSNKRSIEEIFETKANYLKDCVTGKIPYTADEIALHLVSTD